MHKKSPSFLKMLCIFAQKKFSNFLRQKVLIFGHFSRFFESNFLSVSIVKILS